MQAQEAERLWTVKDVAAHLGCSAWWVYEQTRHGRIPFVRIGARLVRFVPDDVRAWASKREAEE